MNSASDVIAAVHGWPPRDDDSLVLATMCDLLLAETGVDGWLRSDVERARTYWLENGDQSFVESLERCVGLVNAGVGRDRERVLLAAICVFPSATRDDPFLDTVDYFVALIDDEFWGR